MTLEYYRDKKREWRWRIKADNGKILADSAEGYTRRVSCIAAVDNIVRAIKNFDMDYIITSAKQPNTLLVRTPPE